MTLNEVADWKMWKNDFHPFHLHTHHFKMKQVPFSGNIRAASVHSVYPGTLKKMGEKRKKKNENKVTK